MGTHPLQRHIIATCVIFDALASLGSILESQWVSQWSMIMLLRFCQPMPDITSDLDCLNTSKRHYRRQKQVKSELQAHHIGPFFGLVFREAIWAKGEAVDVFFISREVLLLKTSFLGKYVCFWAAIWSKGEGGLYEGGRVCPLNRRSTRSSRSVGRFMLTHWGPCSHIVLARCRGSMRRERKDDLAVFWHWCLTSKTRVTNKYGKQHRSTHTPICAR